MVQAKKAASKTENAADDAADNIKGGAKDAKKEVCSDLSVCLSVCLDLWCVFWFGQMSHIINYAFVQQDVHWDSHHLLLSMLICGHRITGNRLPIVHGQRAVRILLAL